MDNIIYEAKWSHRFGGLPVAGLCALAIPYVVLRAVPKSLSL